MIFSILFFSIIGLFGLYKLLEMLSELYIGPILRKVFKGKVCKYGNHTWKVSLKEIPNVDNKHFPTAEVLVRRCEYCEKVQYKGSAVYQQQRWKGKDTFDWRDGEPVQMRKFTRLEMLGYFE